jgi:hypothetical protein
MQKLRVVLLLGRKGLKVFKEKRDHKDRKVRKVLPGHRVHRVRPVLPARMVLRWSFRGVLRRRPIFLLQA